MNNCTPEYGEPWGEDEFQLDMPMMICKGEHAVCHHDWLRIVACVNALAGLNPEAVVGVVEAATDALDEFDRCRIFSGCGDTFDVLRTALAKLRTTAAKPQE